VQGRFTHRLTHVVMVGDRVLHLDVPSLPEQRKVANLLFGLCVIVE